MMFRQAFLLSLTVSLLGDLQGVHAQMVDQNSNGISDVWEQSYGYHSQDTNADSDGDGVPNFEEAIAGTNPFDSNSVPRISFVTPTTTNVNVIVACAAGKVYQLQSILSLGSTNWVSETNIEAGLMSPIAFPVSKSPVTRFFRVMVSDVDTDGDGVSDWEEYKLGLNPTIANSNGHLDNNGQPVSDYNYVTSQLAFQDVVTITASDPIATQPDPNHSPLGTGMYTLTRGGFPLDSITVNLTLAGPGTGFAVEGLDHAAIPRPITLPVGVSSTNIPLTPLADTNLLAPIIAMLQLSPGTGYTIGTAGNASVVIYPSTTPLGMGLFAEYFTNCNATYTNLVNFNPANAVTNRVEGPIDFKWSASMSPNLSNANYTVRWTGQVVPEYSETYFFDLTSDDGARLWVNDQLLIDKWQTQNNTEYTNAISLQAGVRYNIKLEYLDKASAAQVHLAWFSPSQPKQIIPSNRLYSVTGPVTAIAAVTSPLTAVGYLGQPFTFTVTGANTPLGYTANGLPPGLTFNSTNGVISGIPTQAGDFQATLTATNTSGVGASVVNITIFDTGSSGSREVWANVPGNTIADIPIGTPPTSSGAYGALEGITDFGDNYGERIRGYLTVPTTGNYYFWIAGSDSAELWISNDNEPANKVRRAWVTPSANPAPPPNNGTASRQWNLQPNQKSGWLSLVAGQRYYIEVLHKAGTGPGDNWAVGWLQDPTGTNNTPAGVVPSYLISRYFDVPAAFIPGTLYAANMLALPGVASSAVGSASLRLSADETQATVTFQVNNLVGVVTDENIGADPYLTAPSQLLYDISVFKPQADGSYLWKFKATPTLSVADIVELLKEGKATINVQSSAFPNGEISGHFTLADGAQTFSVPPNPPPWFDDHGDSNAAARFLIQSTFGPSTNEIASVQSLGYSNWITAQFAVPPTHHLTNILAKASATSATPYPGTTVYNTWWLESVTAPDQLRQRVAFALSEILVVSDTGVLQDNGRALSSYYDTLLDNAFGNYRDLLKAVTLTPAMGLYLGMQGNDKGNLSLGTHANENYAREIMQLFSIGLNRLWLDGTSVENSQGSLVPTYDQNVVQGFAATFTGWTYSQPNQTNGLLPKSFSPSPNYTNPMVLVPVHHELGTKRLLDNVILPPAMGSQADSTSTNFDNYCSQDLEKALDSIFYNENVGPFVCRQLIQRLVTSNPSRDYIYRVAKTFDDNGSGVRGDLKAVIAAILLDSEARGTNFISVPTYGKLREPLLRVTAMARAFPSPPPMTGTYIQNGDRTNVITVAGRHRLNTGDTVQLYFTDTSGNVPPTSQPYSVTVTNQGVFNINVAGISAATYIQAGNTITVTNSGHALSEGNSVYLIFTTPNSPPSGTYTVDTVPTNNIFTVIAPDFTNRAGLCIFPKWSGGGFVQTTNLLTFSLAGNHGLNPGDDVWINFTPGQGTNGVYTVATVPDATHFTTIAPFSRGQTQNGITIYPLVPPPLYRSGNVIIQFNTWALNATDSGSSSSLYQSPLNSPTVFNFFFPDYKFPGVLASAGLTTPEFQLTSDTSVASQMNYLEAALLNNTGNTNGLSSFASGNGSITLDLGPWMTPAYTSNAGIPNLVNALNSLLCAGQLSAAEKTTIINYVANTANFNYTTPTATQMRDRVRAVVHLITSSPNFVTQK